MSNIMLAPSRALRVSRVLSQQHRAYSDAPSHLPRVASPSFWTSLIPRFLRKPTTAEEALQRAQVRSDHAEERRVGLVFGILGILVGSNAINILSLRREMLNFSRQTDAKLELLREVVQRVKNGEDVDIKKALGTGDPKEEKEWEQVMRELEETDMLREGRAKKMARDEARRERKRLEREQTNAEKKAQSTDATADEATKKPTPKFLM